jgi:hypothetical protein
MKYIKKYKLFESTSDISDDVADILSSIEDEDFSVDKNSSREANWSDGYEMIFIEKMVGDENGYKRSKPYLVNDTILDAVQHLSSYLSKNGYKLIVEAVSKTDVIAHQEYYHRDLGDNISEIQELFEFIGRAPIDYLRLLIYKHNK